MDEETFKENVKEGKVEIIEPEKTEEKPSEISTSPVLEDYITFLEYLRRYKVHGTTAPSNEPSNYLGQMELYDDGTNRRVYFYVNGNWRSVALS